MILPLTTRVYARPYTLYVRGGCADAPALPPASTYDQPDTFWSAKTSAPGTCPPLPGG